VTRILITAGVALGALLALSGPAQAQTPRPACNDNYLESAGLNDPGSRLERKDTLRDLCISTAATTQSDIFNPPRSGGGPEPTTCTDASGTTTYGHTVWYDFYPDVPGTVQVQASGYDAVLRVVPFSLRTGKPNFDRSVCIDEQGVNATERLLVPGVQKGKAYTIQVGGAGTASGVLDFQFDFLADTDGDGVLDDVDDCRTLAGTRRNGCPVRLRVNSILRALPTSTGLEIQSLVVTAPKNSRVSVSCTRGCRSEVRRAHSKINLRNVRGAQLAAGSSIVIRVTKRKAIGAYIRYPILAGNLGTKVERVLCPGSKKPRRSCR
jgi:hypothetical protein